MDCITVTTKEDLKRAIKEKPDKIIIIGKLAEQVKRAERIKKLSPAALAMIGALGVTGVAEIVAAPVTGGASLAFSAVKIIIGSTKLEIPISVLLLISGVGLTLISILFDEYTHVKIKRGEIHFERKRKGKEL